MDDALERSLRYQIELCKEVLRVLKDGSRAELTLDEIYELPNDRLVAEIGLEPLGDAQEYPECQIAHYRDLETGLTLSLVIPNQDFTDE